MPSKLTPLPRLVQSLSYFNIPPCERLRAGSLLLIPSSSTFCLCPHIGLRDISHTHPDNLPNQVRFRYGPSTSYHFLQTPPLASDALVSRILFPVDGARSLLSERRGLPASLGKQKKSDPWVALQI
ncbi:hypothetical protein N8766_04100 [bacterium]|nr:hypothetical protein [bacterium]